MLLIIKRFFNLNKSFQNEVPANVILLAYYKKGDQIIPIIGLPGCVMYSKRTVFDLILPSIMADDKVSA